MPSKSRAGGRLARNQRNRQAVEKSLRLGPTCMCGHTARRVSDRFCTSCGLSLVKSVTPEMVKAGGVTRAELVKAVHAAVDQELDRSGVRGGMSGLQGQIAAVRAQIAANGRRLDELAGMADAYAPQIPGLAKSTSVNSTPLDPYANLTVNGQPLHRNPLLERELSNSDPAVREAAWRAIFNPQKAS